MIRLALLILASVLACSSAAADRLQVAPDDDADVAAGWNAYRVNDAARALDHYRKAADRVIPLVVCEP